MKVTRWHLNFAAGTPGSIECIVYFHIDDAWKDDEWTDATNKWRMTPRDICESLRMRFAMNRYQDITMNSDMVYKVIDEFCKCDWYCKCID